MVENMCRIAGTKKCVQIMHELYEKVKIEHPTTEAPKSTPNNMFPTFE